MVDTNRSDIARTSTRANTGGATGVRRLPAVSVVREELGPSLPELLRPHLGRLSRLQQRLLAAAAIGAVVLLAAAYLVLRSDPLPTIVVREPIAFNLIHRADFPEVARRPGELLRLEGNLPIAKPGAPPARETFVVRPLTVPPFRGDISSAYLSLATAKLAELQAADPQVRYRGEGKARINLIPGYQLSYATRQDGRTLFGRIYWLVPEPAEDGDPQTREGVTLTLTAQFSGQVPNPAAVGSDVLLKAPLRSFRFGTERP